MMNSYEQRVRRELLTWESELLKTPGILEQTSQKLQKRIDHLLPEKVKSALTSAVKGVVKSVLFSMDYVPKQLPQIGLTLEETDQQAAILLDKYKKIAAAEGAGTGAGGILLGFVDFPALIAIKMKFLFELAHLYGYSTHDFRERLFLLYIFQLAFSSKDKKLKLLHEVKHWETTALLWPANENYLEQIDWEQFQKEYRDAIDFRKMLQLIPGIGAVVGAWANYGLLDELGVAGKNSYRLRRLTDNEACDHLLT